MSEVNPQYLDNYEQGSFRTTQAKQHLQYLLGSVEVTGICEIGSGSGGVTAAFRSLYPTTDIRIIDGDPRAIEVARKNGIQAHHMHSTDISPNIIEELSAQGINTIALMRMPADTILQMLKMLKESSFHGYVVASVIDKPHERTGLFNLTTETYRHSPRMSLRKTTLVEEPYSSNDTEHGFLAHFQ